MAWAERDAAAITRGKCSMLPNILNRRTIARDEAVKMRKEMLKFLLLICLIVLTSCVPKQKYAIRLDAAKYRRSCRCRQRQNKTAEGMLTNMLGDIAAEAQLY
ncbi:hypothetical protein BANRA_04956 [Escherichia coli]|nr:hypothetical protein BANRA_04956 [Escherichia coli]